MWTRIDEFETAAQKIGKEFVSSGGTQSINSLATKVAQDAQLNPEGIRTMVRLANVAAFEELFNKRGLEKQADRMIDFEVGDPEVVINKLHSIAKTAHAQTVSSNYNPSLDFYGDFSSPKIPLEKTASAIPDFKVEASNEQNLVSPKQVNYLFKRAEDRLREEKKQLEHGWYSTLEKVAQSLRVLDNRVSARYEFEKIAVSVLGEEIVPELKMVQEMTNPKDATPVLFGGVKLATVIDNYVGNPTPEQRAVLKMIKEAGDTRKNIHRCTSGLEWIKNNIPEVK